MVGITGTVGFYFVPPGGTAATKIASFSAVSSVQSKLIGLRLCQAELSFPFSSSSHRGLVVSGRYGSGCGGGGPGGSRFSRGRRKGSQSNAEDEEALDISAIRSATVRLIDEQQNMVLPYEGCCFDSISHNNIGLTSSHIGKASQQRDFNSNRRYTEVRSCYHYGKWKPSKLCNMKLHRSNQRCESFCVRSDLTGAATPEYVPLKSEFKLGSQIRGVCFYSVTAIAAMFLVILMIIGHPLVLLFDRYKRQFHHFIAKIWASITIFPFYKIKIEGLENLPPPDTPAVYVSNHQSFLDIYTLLTLGRSFKFISKTGIFLFPVIGWAMFMLGVIPLKRMDTRSQMDCLKRCIDLVKKGASVFFFPEGTRSKDGKLGPFKKGAFTVASKTGVPVVPITVVGTGEIMPTGSESIVNHGNVKVIIHKSIQGSKADTLCDEARNIIAESMNTPS